MGSLTETTPMQRLLMLGLLAAAALPATATAQQASFNVFGTACTAPGEPTPQIGSRGLPQLGTSFDVTYSGPNRSATSAQQSVQPVLITGFATLPGPLRVPAWLFPAQPPGCFVYAQPDLGTPMVPAAGGVFESSFSLAVPNNHALIGAMWFHQWIAIFEQCGIRGCDIQWVIASDAAVAIAGT